MKTAFAWLVGVGILVSVAPAYAVDLKEVEKALTTTGVEGWIHGSVESQGLYVFTYRTPGNFFDHIEMSLISDDANITKQFATYDRHDQVRVKGSFMDDNPSPQKHIIVTSIEMLKKYQSGLETTPYEHQAQIPNDLLGKTSANFLVHAVAGDGQILVVEYKDVILPIFVKNGDLAKNLFRGDLVQLQFKIQRRPHEPVHLNLNEHSDQSPVQVLESVKALHGKTASIEGALILFPKSPEILFNVFAVKQDLVDGLSRQYTLVNFDSPDTFAKIRAALQAAWDRHGNDYVNGRNKFVANHIRVKATGTFNEVDANQANPQILLNSVSSIQIIE